MRRNVLNFGHFLLQKGLITEQDMYNARFSQKKRNLRVGEIAKAKDWLSDDDIQRILIMAGRHGITFIGGSGSYLRNYRKGFY